MKTFPKISVIIPAYNAEKTIKQCIKSLLRQDYPNYEIIIVDHFSSDNTTEIIKKYKKIKYLNEYKNGPSVARNMGVRYSKGKIIAFTDADCVLRRDWITKLTGPILSGKCNATMGGTLSVLKGKLNSIEQEAYEDYLSGIKRGTHLKTIDTRNFAILRTVFDDTESFDENIMFAEDYCYGLKLNKMGYKPLFVNHAEVKHYHKSSFKRIFRTKLLQNFWHTYYYDKKGLLTNSFRLNYYISLLFLIITIVTLLIIIINRTNLSCVLIIMPIFLIMSSTSVLKNICKANLYAAFYHLISVIAVRLGIQLYIIKKFTRLKI